MTRTAEIIVVSEEETDQQIITATDLETEVIEVGIPGAQGAVGVLEIDDDGNPIVVPAGKLDFHGAGFAVSQQPAQTARIELNLSDVVAGGELGGNLASPTVDAFHSGSTHQSISDAVNAHLIDVVDAHDASAVSFVPTGTITSADAQSAIVEALTDAKAYTDDGHVIRTSQRGVADGVAGLDSGGAVPDAQIPAAVARDSEVASAGAAHVAAADPHTGYQKESEKGATSGYASLDSSGKVPTAQIPAVAFGNTFVVASEAAMLALAASPGDIAVRSDISETFILTASPASTLGNWTELLSGAGGVTSVNGATGAVTGVELAANKGANSGYAALDSSGLVPDAQISAAIARDSEVSSAVSTHAAAGDPHTGYQKESEKGATSGYAALDGSGYVPDAQIDPAIARGTAVTSAISTTEAYADAADTAHAVAGDPHAQYETAAEAQALVDVHTADVAEAHGASAVSFTPGGTVAATDVQAAIAEIASEVASGESLPFVSPTLSLSASAAAGSAASVIRSDATIQAFDATNPTTSAVGDAAVIGLASKAARRDHTHAREGFGSPSTQAFGDAAATGTATTIPHSDHKHAMPANPVTLATPAIALGTAAAAGSAASVIRSDATIVAFDATLPTTEAFGGVATAGSAAVAARRDHKHALPAAPTATTVPFTPSGTIAATNSQAAILEALSDGKAYTDDGHVLLSSRLGANSGVANLDSTGKVPVAELPSLTFGHVFTDASQVAMLAESTAVRGDISVRTDTGNSYILAATPPATLGNWVLLFSGAGAVSSVNTRTGAVTGIEEVTNKDIAGGYPSLDASGNQTLAKNFYVMGPKPWVDVEKKYGLVVGEGISGTDRSNNTNRLNAAISDNISQTGRMLLLPPTTIEIADAPIGFNATADMRASLAIRGWSREYTIIRQMTDGQPTMQFGTSSGNFRSLSLEQFCLRGQTTVANATPNLQLNKVGYCVFRDLTIWQGSGVLATNNCFDLTLQNCWIYNCTGYAVKITGGEMTLSSCKVGEDGGAFIVTNAGLRILNSALAPGISNKLDASGFLGVGRENFAVSAGTLRLSNNHITTGDASLDEVFCSVTQSNVVMNDNKIIIDDAYGLTEMFAFVNLASQYSVAFRDNRIAMWNATGVPPVTKLLATHSSATFHDLDFQGNRFRIGTNRDMTVSDAALAANRYNIFDNNSFQRASVSSEA